MLNHEPLRLADGEYRFACLVWDNEPLPSGQLVALAAEGLGWKKSTTYTVLKKLCERGVLQNADGRVTSLIKKEDVQQAESAAVVDKTFDGSLPRFVAAFLFGLPSGSSKNISRCAHTSTLSDATYNGISPMIWTPRLFAYCFSCIHCLKNSYWQNLQNMMSLCNIS